MLLEERGDAKLHRLSPRRHLLQRARERGGCAREKEEAAAAREKKVRRQRLREEGPAATSPEQGTWRRIPVAWSRWRRIRGAVVADDDGRPGPQDANQESVPDPAALFLFLHCRRRPKLRLRRRSSSPMSLAAVRRRSPPFSSAVARRRPPRRHQSSLRTAPVNSRCPGTCRARLSAGAPSSSSPAQLRRRRPSRAGEEKAGRSQAEKEADRARERRRPAARGRRSGRRERGAEAEPPTASCAWGGSVSAGAGAGCGGWEECCGLDFAFASCYWRRPILHVRCIHCARVLVDDCVSQVMDMEMSN